MLDETWRFYSERVDGLDPKKTKIKFSQHYLAGGESMPLPASFAIKVAERISRGDPHIQARVFSRYPWPGRDVCLRLSVRGVCDFDVPSPTKQPQ